MKAETKAFGLIQSYDYLRKKHGIFERLQYLEVELSNWLFRGIEAKRCWRSAATISGCASIDGRLCDLARKHCGKQANWRVSFDVLQKKVGSHTARERKFTEYMCHVASENHLPDYAMTLEDGQAVFWRRGDGAGGQKPRPAFRAPAAAEPGYAGASAEASKPASTPAAGRRIGVSQRAIEQLYNFAPGWDKYMLEHTYMEWAKDKEAARNEDARFLGWVKSYTKGKPAP